MIAELTVGLSRICHVEAGWRLGRLEVQFEGPRGGELLVRIPAHVWSPEHRLAEGRGRRVSQLRWSHRAEIPPSSAFLSYWGPQWIGGGPRTPGRTLGFTQFTNSNIDLSPKPSHGHTQKSQPASYLGARGPARLTRKTNDHDTEQTVRRTACMSVAPATCETPSC